MKKTKRKRNTMQPRRIQNELHYPAHDAKKEKKRSNEGPLPLGSLFTKADDDFLDLKRGFSF